LFDFLEGLASSVGQVFIPGMLLVAGDAAATAANILSHELLFKLSFSAALIAVGCHIAWTFLFYELFKPVNQKMSLLAAFVGLVGIATQAFSTIFQYAPLVILQSGASSSAFNTPQLQALAQTFLELRLQAFNTYIAFFGLWCVLTGYLIYRSAFMPRIIGVLEAISGVCWLTFLWPPLVDLLFPTFTGTLAAPGELSLQLWLIFFGVNAQRWTKQAQGAGTVHSGRLAPVQAEP
jgi:hypothetical protein